MPSAEEPMDFKLAEGEFWEYQFYYLKFRLTKFEVLENN